ncbi:hypothetical protein EVAR_86865_1 [Eumeta japonica]|uniref:Uncharacterized protein n=1 Tax=Eumeta variegata TaxID=151549 RepID=A0A4C1VVG5_EUMVA|nr:hypothetical protein EVAR_86865_1 [Eumeta japonica]
MDSMMKGRRKTALVRTRLDRANVCGGKVALENHMHTISVEEKGQILGTRNRRACIKRWMDVSEAREICKDISTM